jgi:uncharacterized RDD family membrane protein YckC
MSTPDPSLPRLGIRLSSLADYMSAPGSLQGVSFWPRAFARLIDLGTHFGVSYCAGRLFGAMLVIAAGGHVPHAVYVRLRSSSILSFVLVLLGSILFEAVCEAVHGSTPGKMVFGIVVVQDDGTPCRVKSALIRSFAYLIDGLFFGLIAYSSMKQSPQEQRLGDEWADTVVCNRSDLPPTSLRGTGVFVMALFFAVLADATLCMLALHVKLVA